MRVNKQYNTAPEDFCLCRFGTTVNERPRLQPARTLTPLLSSLELELPPSELLDLGQELDPFSDRSSLDTPVTPPSSNSFSHTPSWDSLCPKPWVSSVWWWLSSFCSPSKHFTCVWWSAYIKLLFCWEIADLNILVLKRDPKNKKKQYNTAAS